MNSSKVNTFVAGAALGIAALAAVVVIDASRQPAASPAAAVAPDPTTPDNGAIVRTVTVSGNSVVTIKPDTANLQIGVTVVADSANGALRTAADKANALIGTLRAAGISEDDIQTSNVALYPRYDNNGQRITGYQASNDLSVTVRDLGKVGSVIDTAADKVGDEITLNGIWFSVDDDAASIADARAAAIADAKLRAGQFADAAGASVGEVLTISEVSVGAPQPTYYAAERAAAGDSATPIQPGTQDLSVNVTVTYALD